MRALRIWIIVVLVVGGLFVAADRLGVSLVEDEIASKTRQAQGLSSEPDVSIEGFPFLTQIAAGKLDEVRVSVDGLEASGSEQSLRIERFTATLRGVRLTNGYTSAVADTADGSAMITYAALSKAAPEGVSVGYGGGEGKVKVTGTVQVPLMGAVERSVISTVGIEDGNTVTVRADSVPGVEAIPGVEERIREKTDFTRELAGLPAGLELKSVETSPEGVSIAGTGTGVVLAG